MRHIKRLLNQNNPAQPGEMRHGIMTGSNTPWAQGPAKFNVSQSIKNRGFPRPIHHKSRILTPNLSEIKDSDARFLKNACLRRPIIEKCVIPTPDQRKIDSEYCRLGTRSMHMGPSCAHAGPILVSLGFSHYNVGA